MRNQTNLLVVFARLPAVVYLLFAAAVIAGGYYFSQVMEQRAIERQAAIEAGPPSSTNIEDFDQSLHSNSAGEVVLRAQMELELRYHLEIEGSVSSQHAFMVGLVAADGPPDEIIGLVFYEVDSPDDINQDFLWDTSSGFGTLGPIVKVHGQQTSLGTFDDLAADAFRDEGYTLTRDVMIIRPFFAPREEELKPIAHTDVFLYFLIAGAVLALIGAGKFAFKQLLGHDQPRHQAEAPSEPFSLGNGPVKAFEPVDPVAALSVPKSAFGPNFGAQVKNNAQAVYETGAAGLPKGSFGSKFQEQAQADLPEWQKRLIAKQNGGVMPGEAQPQAQPQAAPQSASQPQAAPQPLDAPRVLDPVAGAPDGGPVVSGGRGGLRKVVMGFVVVLFVFVIGAVIYGSMKGPADPEVAAAGTPTESQTAATDGSGPGVLGGLEAIGSAVEAVGGTALNLTGRIETDTEAAASEARAAAEAARAAEAGVSEDFIANLEAAAAAGDGLGLVDAVIDETVQNTPEEEMGRWDIDLAPVYRWFLKTAAAAMAGDMGALITLTLIGLAVLIGPVMLRLGIKAHFAGKRRMAVRSHYYSNY